MKFSKSGIIAAACLGAAALTGVGFAGWYIVSDDTRNAEGNITVYEISDKTVEIGEMKWDETGTDATKGKIVFGKPSDADSSSFNDSQWFRFDDNVVTEHLTATLAFTVTDHAKLEKSPTVTATLKIADGASGSDSKCLKGYYNCKNNNYITGPDLVEQEGNNPNYTYKAKEATSTNASSATGNDEHITVTSKASANTSGDDKTWDVTITLSFGWGSKFGNASESQVTGVNPFSYYNSLEGGANSNNISSAKEAMAAIYELNSLTYSLAVTVKNEA